jgi:intergrase/recombinase
VKASSDFDISENCINYQEQATSELVEVKEPQVLSDVWVQHSQSFNDWLSAKDISESTKRDYFNALKKFFENTSIQRPQEFRGHRLKDKEERGLRNLLNYFEDEEIDDICGYGIDKWRRYIKIKKSGVCEIYITDAEIKEAYDACSDDLKTIYSLLIYSGNRLSHIYQMLKTFDERNIVIDGDVAHYPTSSFSKGTKRTFQIYFPASFIPKLKNIGNICSYYSLLKQTKFKRVSSKTIRKWHLNLMIKEGVTESLADFIQGRAPATVGSAHYLNKVQHAKDEYRRIMGEFCFLYCRS